MSNYLTADQVREAAHRYYKLRMVLDVDGFGVPQVMFDWKAIADELNATLGSETCDWLMTCSWLLECSNCGEKCHKDDARKYKHCPGCGVRCSGKVVER